MKKTLLLLLFFTGITNAQIVNIPDANFKAKLLSAAPTNQVAIDLTGSYFKIDVNNDGEIQVSEALQVKELFVNNSNIANLTGIEAFTNVIFLKCSSNQLTFLNINQNLNLKKLYCAANMLSALNVTANINLEELWFGINFIQSIDLSQNINLKNLQCYTNPMNVFDVTQNVNLEVLMCFDMGLNSLNVTQNVNLRTLMCFDNLLTNIDVSQNVNLRHLDCKFNAINTLNVTQNPNLVILFCSDTQLSNLDVSHNNLLADFICDNNQLTSLNTSQNPNLDRLSVKNNLLTNINVSNNLGLRYLYFDDNQITTLNANQHIALLELGCANNQMSTLYIKNGKNEILNISGNPNLNFICADESQVASVQAMANPGAVVSSNCLLTPGENYNSVSGVVIFDQNNDGCNVADPLFPDCIRLDLTSTSETSGVYPNTDGSYTLFASQGNHSLTTQLENPSWFNVSPSSTTISFPLLDGSIQNQNFCITANGVHNDLEIIIAPAINQPPRPGFDSAYLVIYKNKGNQILSGDIALTYEDDILDYVSGTDFPDTQSTGQLNWNFTNLFPFEKRSFFVIFNVNSPTETPPVIIGDQLEFTASINPVANDETPADNVFYLKQRVEGSYDPNDKTCLEGEVVSPTKIGEYLHYRIRFENTGTAAATFVIVRDTIDVAKFDIGSLQVMYASHPMVTKIKGNVVEFVFDNINLPSDDAHNDGGVVFKIKTKSDLVEGDAVANKAEIYFDYNFPILTNTALTTFREENDPGITVDNSIKVHPNPVEDMLDINSNFTIKAIELFDLQGRVLVTKLINQGQTFFDVSGYSNGVYFLKISTIKGIKTEKIVKE